MSENGDGGHLLVAALEKKLHPENRAKFAKLEPQKKVEVATILHDVVHKESLAEGRDPRVPWGPEDNARVDRVISNARRENVRFDIRLKKAKEEMAARKGRLDKFLGKKAEPVEEGVKTIRGVLSRFQYRRGATDDNGVTTWTHSSGHTVRTGNMRKLGGNKFSRGNGWAAKGKSVVSHVSTDPESLQSILQGHHNQPFHEDSVDEALAGGHMGQNFAMDGAAPYHLQSRPTMTAGKDEFAWYGPGGDSNRLFVSGSADEARRKMKDYLHQKHKGNVSTGLPEDEPITVDNADEIIESFLSEADPGYDEKVHNRMVRKIAKAGDPVAAMRQGFVGADRRGDFGNNIYALGHHLGAAHRVEARVKKGEAFDAAFAAEFIPTRTTARVARLAGSKLKVHRGEWVHPTTERMSVEDAERLVMEATKKSWPKGVARIPDDHSGYYDDGLGGEIHHADAREIAGHWHDGQFSPLYKLSSTGHVDRETDSDIARLRADVKKSPHMYPEDDGDEYDNATQLARLHTYVKARLKAGHHGRLTP